MTKPRAGKKNRGRMTTIKREFKAFVSMYSCHQNQKEISFVPTPFEAKI